MKNLFNKYREIIMYLVFGVLTTVVGFGTYFLIMAGAEHLLDIPMEDETSVTYITVYVIAQIIRLVLRRNRPTRVMYCSGLTSRCVGISRGVSMRMVRNFRI